MDAHLPAPIGELVGSWRLDALLGHGAMGAVYLGTHQVLGRRAAIKVLRNDLAANPQYVSRFIHEARVVNEVRHPNIVEVHDFIRTDSPPRIAYVMELLRGPSLGSVLAERTLTVRQAVNACYQMALALEAVHAIGVVHRDLKPDNVIVTASLESDLSEVPSVKIVDFGIAKLSDVSVAHRTITGTVIGTPQYMAPEQVAGQPVSPATDVYALAEIFFEAVTGRPVFGQDNPILEKLRDSAPELPVPDALSSVAGAIAGLTRACLSPEQRARPPLPDFREALLDILASAPEGVVLAPSPLGLAETLLKE